MQQQICIGCKKSFQEGQTLPPEGIHIQYKNYYLPVREHQQRWILLKTIIAFLNSKGGTIYMGVDDATREVIGVTAQLKQQDQFMLELDNLIHEIQPIIDLRHKEEVRCQFVPVLKDKAFQGKYIIKIIVKQGDPSKVYHFAQTLKFFSEDKRSHDEEFKVLWGFYRSNMGKVDSIKGTQLLREVYEKAKRPSTIIQNFHEGCHPEPLRVSVRNLNIGFKNVKNVDIRQDILGYIQTQFKKHQLEASYSIEQAEDDTILLKFKSITEYKQADTFILDHIDHISKIIQGQDMLIDEGVIDNTHFYRIGKKMDPSARYRRKRSPPKNTQPNLLPEPKPRIEHHHSSSSNASTTKTPHHISKHQSIQSNQSASRKRSDEGNLLAHNKQFLKSTKSETGNSKEQPTAKYTNQVYLIKFYQISEKSFDKMFSYLQNSLGKKLSLIAHKTQAYDDEKEIIISFPTQKDLQLFLQELMSNEHHQKVLNGFTDNRHISFIVRRKSQTVNMNFDTHFEKSKSLPDTNINSDISLYISNIRPNLTVQQRQDFQKCLKNICSLHFKDQKIEIKDEEKLLVIGVIELIFQKSSELHNFSNILQTEMIKKEEFINYFSDGKVHWGSLTGNITLWNYNPQDKKLFKQQIENIFVFHQDFTYNSSKYMKNENGEFSLTLNFKQQNLLSALIILHEQIKTEPFIGYGLTQGIQIELQLKKV